MRQVKSEINSINKMKSRIQIPAKIRQVKSEISRTDIGLGLQNSGDFRPAYLGGRNFRQGTKTQITRHSNIPSRF